MPRLLALDVLDHILIRGKSLDDAFAQARRLNELAPRDRGLARRLVSETLRRLGQIDDLIDRFLERPLPRKARPARQVLRLGLSQLLFLDTPAHAAVDTSVELAVARGMFAHKALVNAILRRAAREGSDLVARQDAAVLNAPAWLRKRWVAAYGEAVCREICLAHLNEPPLDVTAKTDPEGVARELGGELLPGGTVRLRSPGPISELPGYGDGAWWVQDAAAALPVRLLDPEPGMHVADLCAAPGGKTAQLAAAGARVTAIDRSEKRLDILRANLDRLGLNAEVICADATGWHPAEPVDAVLVDAPCSSTGTIRRHPELPWIKTETRLEGATDVQRRLLDHALQIVRPGGRVVFATCSLEPAEGRDIVSAVLERHEGLKFRAAEPSAFGLPPEATTPAGHLRTLPSHWAERGGMDGFFAAMIGNGTN